MHTQRSLSLTGARNMTKIDVTAAARTRESDAKAKAEFEAAWAAANPFARKQPYTPPTPEERAADAATWAKLLGKYGPVQSSGQRRSDKQRISDEARSDDETRSDDASDDALTWSPQRFADVWRKIGKKR
jgi:hypothetical protein